MLEITNSAIGRYKIYKINNEYYLLDTKVSFFPLQLFIAPHLREVRGYKFDENTIKPFYKTSESIPIGLLSAVLITQPFVTFFII